MLGKNSSVSKSSLKALPLERCLAKSVENDMGQTSLGVSVKDHCRITGFVAEELLKVLAPSQKLFLPNSAVFCAAVHDIGKVCPDFQRMIYKSVEIEAIPKELQNADENRAKRKEASFHGKVSQVTIEKFVKESGTLCLLEGMHHGFKPNPSPIDESAVIYGGDLWTEKRRALFDYLKSEFSCETIRIFEDWKEACVLGGFITVADWIASGGSFSHLPLNHFKTDVELREMAKIAVNKAGFDTLSIKKGLSFSDIFGFEPRKIQSDLFDAVEGPGVYILEAPMGLGKTEAALYAAYKALEAGFASGIYFGLPTQLTSNKIYERVEKFLNSIVDNFSRGNLKLLHSSAWMEDDSMGEDACSRGSWFDSKKRGILAPFAVGTIDQALMAAMNVKHSMVRSFGLAGKVVILDEVHSYDSYTGTIMNELVHQLKNIGCTVIVLSATLTSAQKKNILKLNDAICLDEAYPLVTVQNKKFQEIPCECMDERCVDVSLGLDDAKALETAVEKASYGEQVLWIENTVDDAQKIYKKMAARALAIGIECGLIHSRYTRKERSDNESKWVSLYGKKGMNTRRKCGRILVGTQILEQSIDVDADFLVSRICPMDMLLQRTGRLWRHRENDSVRPISAKCEILVLAPNYESVTKKIRPFGMSGVVYSPYVLCRTLNILQMLNKIHLPRDIRPLLNSVYECRDEVGIMASMKSDLEKVQKSLQGMARIGLSTAIQTLPESTMQTRYSELQTFTILLLDSFKSEDNGFRVKFYGEKEEIFIPRKCFDEKKKRNLSKQIMLHSVNVSGNRNLSNIPPVDEKIREFRDYVYLGNVVNSDDDEDCLFRVVIVGKDSSFRNLQNVSMELNDDDCIKKLLYTKNLGYQVEKQVN